MPDEKRDIVERLRAFTDSPLHEQAAATIEVLRAECRTQRAANESDHSYKCQEGCIDAACPRCVALKKHAEACNTTDAAHALGKESPNAE